MRQGMTLKEIARLANVNPSTVSRVLNPRNSHPISLAVSEKIRAIAAQHHFMPQQAGHSLASKQSFKLGVVLNDLEMDFGDPFASAILSRFMFESRFHGYHTLVFPIYNGGMEEQVLESIRAGQADAYWVGTDMMNARVVEELLHRGVPIASCYLDVRPMETLEGIELFELSLGRAFEEMFTLAANLGHRSYCFFYRDCPLCSRMRRYDGFRGGGRYGVTLAEEVSFQGARSALRAYRDAVLAVRKNWSRLSQHSLIVCANDFMGMAVCDVMAEHGLVPGVDISVTGFENLGNNPYFQAGRPAEFNLATFEVPRYTFGEEISRYLISRINGEAIRPLAPIELKFIRNMTLGPVRK